MNPQFILLLILTAVRLWIAVQLFMTARKSKLNNLYWLAGLFLLAVYSAFVPLSGSPFGNYWIFHLGFIAGHFCLAMFIHTTFYRDRKSPVVFVLGLVVLAFLVDIYALSVNDINLAGIITSVGLVNWIWHLFAARAAYAAIATDSSVENWVKARYQLMNVYIVMMIISTIQVVASSSNLSPFIPPFLLPIILLVVIASIIIQFLVWVMPEDFRKWLNREQIRSTQENQHSLFMLDVFGTAMTDGTGLKSIVCLYAIRAAVAKKIGSEDSATIQRHLEMMTYHEWDSIMQHAELRRVLINGGADYTSANKAIANAQQALVEKQSLLTLSAH